MRLDEWRCIRAAARTSLALTIGVCVGAAGGARAAEPVAPQLPEALRSLLQQEMVAIRDASHEILDALVMGLDEAVAVRAQEIHDSFIMKQKLTEADRQILERTLPPAFVALDRDLHAAAAALATAARQADGPAQRARFAEMVETCAACHGRFATNRFPAFPSD